MPDSTRQGEDKMTRLQKLMVGLPTIELPTESVALQAANKIFARLMEELALGQTGVAS